MPSSSVAVPAVAAAHLAAVEVPVASSN